MVAVTRGPSFALKEGCFPSEREAKRQKSKRRIEGTSSWIIRALPPGSGENTLTVDQSKAAVSVVSSTASSLSK